MFHNFMLDNISWPTLLSNNVGLHSSVITFTPSMLANIHCGGCTASKGRRSGTAPPSQSPERRRTRTARARSSTLSRGLRARSQWPWSSETRTKLKNLTQRTPSQLKPCAPRFNCPPGSRCRLNIYMNTLHRDRRGMCWAVRGWHLPVLLGSVAQHWLRDAGQHSFNCAAVGQHRENVTAFD